MNRQTEGVPRHAEALLRTVVRDPDVCDGLLGDLAEDCAAALGPQAPRWRRSWWYWRAILAFSARYRITVASSDVGSPREGSTAERSRGRMTTLEALRGDLRGAVRGLWRSPGFTSVTVTILALGIGGTTALFSVVHAVLLEPLPFEEPDRLAGVWLTSPGMGVEWLHQSPATYLTFRDESRSFEDVALWGNRQLTVTGTEAAERVPAMMVTDGIFNVLRIEPVLGRAFTAEDDSPGTPLTIMLGHGYWQREFGGDPAVIGRTITADGSAREIIGVMPPAVQVLHIRSDLYFPARLDRTEAEVGDFSYQAIARLAEGVTLERAVEDMARMMPLAVERFPGGMSLEQVRSAGLAPRIRPLHEELVGSITRVLWFLLGAVGVVLVIACANVANLLMVRSEGRRREVAVRTAIGASRGQIARQRLTESLALGALGGLIGLALARGGVQALVGLAPDGFPRIHEVGIDGTVLGFAVATTVAASLLFGTAPALRNGDAGLSAALRDGGRGGGTSRDRLRVREALVVSQVALALVLLVGSGLMVRSFMSLRAVQPGFSNASEVLGFRVNLPRGEVASQLDVAAFHETVISDISRIPGVVSMSGVNSLPMDGWDSNQGLHIEDFPTAADTRPPQARVKWVAGDYFETLQVPLLAGTGLTWDHARTRAEVVVVNEAYAREHWGNVQGALGRRIRYDTEAWHRIVGVAADTYDNGLGVAPVPTVYWPLMVDGFWGGRPWVPRWFAYAVRTSRPEPTSLVPEIREVIRATNPNIPLFEVQTLQDLADRSIARTTFTLSLLAGTTVVAILLAIVGIYGVIAYAVSQRTREMGLRMALGARPHDVRTLVLGNGLKLAAAGVSLGALVSLGLTRVMATLLFGVRSTDPLTYLLAGVGIVVVALGATYLPAARASRVDPMEALAAE